MKDTLLRLFEKRAGWWIGALDDALTFSKRGGRSGAMSTFVAEQELARFIDESLEMKRTLRNAI